MLLDIVSRRNYTAPPLLGPSNISNHTTAASKVLDTEGARGCAITIFTGAVAGDDGTANTCTVHLQESDDTVAADFTDVAFTSIVRYSQAQSSDAAQTQAIQGGVDAGILAWPLLTSNVIIRLGYLGIKRYIRVNLVFAGTGISALNLVVLGQLEFAYLIPEADISPITAT